MGNINKILEQIKDYYRNLNTQPCVVAMGEMAGFPSPITGKITTYVDLLRNGLSRLSQPEIYDFQSLFFQKSYFMESLLIHNPTVAELYRLMRNSVDTTKKQSNLNDMLVRSRLKSRYRDEFTDEINVHEVLKTGHGTIVIRSSLSNDISYKVQENVLSVLGKKGRTHAASVILEQKDKLISEIIEDIVKVYRLIYALNPNACILEVGIDLPFLFQLCNRNPEMREINRCLLELIEALKSTLTKEGVSYITGKSVESNSLLSGQQKLYYEIVQVLAEKLSSQTIHFASKGTKEMFQYQGLKGMMHQEEIFAKDYFSLYQQTEDLNYYNLYREHMMATSCYQKTIGIKY